MQQHATTTTSGQIRNSTAQHNAAFNTTGRLLIILLSLQWRGTVVHTLLKTQIKPIALLLLLPSTASTTIVCLPSLVVIIGPPGSLAYVKYIAVITTERLESRQSSTCNKSTGEEGACIRTSASANQIGFGSLISTNNPSTLLAFSALVSANIAPFCSANSSPSSLSICKLGR